ncbi:ATP12 family chaperone protein [Pelagerythrobacter sp.]|uniref:ATP12 family chaperone protein n=1 Tax=Pelagerythrobacter sp. TaxID=2800702 RepID=UPI0035AD8777
MKRFYREAAAAEVDGGWQVALDGRAVKTAGGAPQIVPTRALAEALAAEWNAQGETLDPAAFLMRGMADHAIDTVRPDRSAAIAKLLAFGETDTLCYRADPDEPLHPRQREAWEPLLAALEAREGIRFERVSGVMHRAQPPETLDALRARLETFNEFTLAALQAMASLTASLCVALAALENDADAADLWALANLEEDWQADLWGRDAEAEARGTARGREFTVAQAFARLAREQQP